MLVRAIKGSPNLKIQLQPLKIRLLSVMTWMIPTFENIQLLGHLPAFGLYHIGHILSMAPLSCSHSPPAPAEKHHLAGTSMSQSMSQIHKGWILIVIQAIGKVIEAGFS